MERKTTQQEIDDLLRRADKARKRAEVLTKRAEQLQKVAQVVPTVDSEMLASHTVAPDEPAYDFSYTQNRELSWLQFDNRVLDEAFDPSVPLLERLNYVAIFQSNLDEWVMIRVGGLTDLALMQNQVPDNKGGQTAAEQLDDIYAILPHLLARQREAFDQIEAELAEKRVVRVAPGALTREDETALEEWYETALAPYLSPLVIDPRHPFPKIRNGRLQVLAALEDAEGDYIGAVEIPRGVRRVVELPGGEGGLRYLLVEDVVAHFAWRLFGSMAVRETCVLRVTRNADLDPDRDLLDDGDYRSHMKAVLRKRLRLAPIRMEIQGSFPPELVDYIRTELGLEERAVFSTTVPLDLSYVRAVSAALPAALRDELSFEHFEPQPSVLVDPARSMRANVAERDILLAYPYESMQPLLRLLREAAADDECISIKITLYRVAKQSRLCESLVAAAEAGKEVTVLMELRARFDESNNIEWAERLEAAGCSVMYGAEGYKVHSKVCQIVYHTPDGIEKIVCLGTGNFNEETARLYSDFMLMTAHPGINDDVTSFFRNLSLGRLEGDYAHLGVAPHGLKTTIMAGLDREIARARRGEPARVVMKMNSLTDRDVIDRIAEATRAGVSTTLIVRGICCILPGVAGKTDGLHVRSIVGRLLEHARVYAFGADEDLVYLSSADMMTRNTERRVEIAFPIYDEAVRAKIVSFVEMQLADTVKARELHADGTWHPVENAGAPLNVQEALMAAAVDAAASLRRRDRPTAAFQAQPARDSQVLPDPEELDKMLAEASLDIVNLDEMEETGVVFETGLYSVDEIEERLHEPSDLAFLDSKGRFAGWASLMSLAHVFLFRGAGATRQAARARCERDARLAVKELEAAEIRETKAQKRAERDQQAAIRRREGN